MADHVKRLKTYIYILVTALFSFRDVRLHLYKALTSFLDKKYIYIFIGPTITNKPFRPP